MEWLAAAPLLKSKVVPVHPVRAMNGTSGGFMALASVLWEVSRRYLSHKRSRLVNSAWELLCTKLNMPGNIPGHRWCMLATE